ncbi:3'-5' exonuclease KapD [Bacillus sp. RG28]|uniref:3'-5' exonuclease KapD n=1 Tax=Gottfriedia endophytica TaxID=2820819 RepID=A0A940SJL6_9BACI|nr:3'-5' exonuclease KapD [Gottfriedia endophytica]MBP0725596.1 3'-5' exonuclease KapD [Gottfriedia endophytica]
MKKQLLFIDFEFTMPEGKKNGIKFYPEIIEVGYISVIDDKITETFSSFVKPNLFPILTERCKRFLNISQDNVNQGISIQDLGKKLHEATVLHDTNVITWGNMDMKVLKHNCEAMKIDFPITGKFRDLSLEYKSFFGNQNQTGLWNALKEYGKDGTGKHHKALDDAKTTYHIYQLVEKDKQYMEKPEPAKIGDLVDFSKLLNKTSAI